MTKPRFTIKRADDTSALSHFFCGEKPIDDFIHNTKDGLAKHIELGLSKLFIVFEGQQVVAFFALSKDALILNSADRHMISKDSKIASALPPDDESFFWDKDKFPAVEIDYFAVSEHKRYSHIGSALIGHIIDEVAQDSLSATLFITVEAYDTRDYSAVGFYKKCGFKLSESGQVRNQSMMIDTDLIPTTTRMYIPVIPSTAK